MMIEKIYGEAIYDYDVWTAALNESPYVLWLQKDNSEDKLQLDVFDNINFGLPKVKINVEQVAGLAGGVFKGIPVVENREFSFKSFFAGNDYKTALNGERIDFILNWFEYDRDYKMYLYWYVKDRVKTYRIEVRPSISGESYKKYLIAKDVNINLIAAKSYFEAVEETAVEEELIITEGLTYHTVAVDNKGLETPLIIEIIPYDNISTLKVTTSRGTGFESSYSFPSGKKIIIDSATGIVTLDGVVMNSFFSSGSPFNLVRGMNYIYITLIHCDFTVRYKERVK